MSICSRLFHRRVYFTEKDNFGGRRCADIASRRQGTAAVFCDRLPGGNYGITLALIIVILWSPIIVIIFIIEIKICGIFLVNIWFKICKLNCQLWVGTVIVCFFSHEICLSNRVHILHASSLSKVLPFMIPKKNAQKCKCFKISRIN